MYINSLTTKGFEVLHILSAEGISKSYSEKILFNDISIGINEGEKIGLIGINGTGKSALLKILAGEEKPDTGSIITVKGIRIGYLPQNPAFDTDITVLQHVFKGNSPEMQLLREYDDVLQKAEENPDDSQIGKRLVSLNQRMDTAGAWNIESEAKNILTRLGIHDFNADIGTLSGGQKKRVAMAYSLITPSDLLILDEPTNHIDNDTVDWLEKYLNNRRGALLMVTHDRYFLDRVANRIIELDRGRLFSFQANYSKYLEMKAEREELEQSVERKRQSLFRSELEWIRKGAKARSTKQKARIDRFQALQDEKTLADIQNIEINAGAARLGKKVIELVDVCKSYPGADLINDFNYILLRDDRIGIIGPNGSGKSTLLKLIAGRLKPDRGCVTIGETVKIGYFGQENDEPEVNLRLIDYIREEAEFITTREGNVTAAQMLERFLFPPAVQWTPVSRLSGGEKRRLYLLRILMSSPNILLLDEPTNDLDIKTLAILESYIDDFAGAVIAVSHDRYFLDRVTDKLFIFVGGGKIDKFTGNYSDYRESIDASIIKLENRNNNPEIGKKTYNTENSKSKPLKFTFKEQKEFDRIDGIIAELEAELKMVNKSINEASSDFQRLQELLSDKEQLEKQLDSAIERWTYLNEIYEKMEKGDFN